MKNILIILSVLLAVLALSIVSVGSVSDDDLRVSSIVIDNELNAGETKDLVTRVNLDNVGSVDFDDVKVTVSVPELGLRRSVGPFSLDEDDTSIRRIVLDMADEVSPGEYYVKIEARANGITKTKYRLITVE